MHIIVNNKLSRMTLSYFFFYCCLVSNKVAAEDNNWHEWLQTSNQPFPRRQRYKFNAQSHIIFGSAVVSINCLLHQLKE